MIIWWLTLPSRNDRFATHQSAPGGWFSSERRFGLKLQYLLVIWGVSEVPGAAAAGHSGEFSIQMSQGTARTQLKRRDTKGHSLALCTDAHARNKGGTQNPLMPWGVRFNSWLGSATYSSFLRKLYFNNLYLSMFSLRMHAGQNEKKVV